MKVYKFSKQDGNVVICSIADKRQIEKKLKRSLSDAEFDEHVAKVSVPKNEDLTEVEVFHKGFIDDSELPTSKIFRQAWRDDGSKIQVDMPIARNIHLDRLRLLRNEKLKRLDVEYMKALELNDAELMDSIRTLKQRLRDMPADCRPELEAIETPDELKDYKPEVLTSEL